VEEMKSVTIQHEEEVITIVVKFKEEMDKVTYCLKATKQNFLKMRINKESWQAKNMSMDFVM
jgi:hypothetical protein